MKQKQIIVLAVLSGMILLFQNCDQTAVQFENTPEVILPSETLGGDDASANDNNSGSGEQLEEVDPNNPNDEAIDNNYEVITNACQQLENQTAEFNIDFPDFEGCAYNQDGNLGPRNGYYQARVEHTRMIQLPEGAILCDIDLNTEVTTMYYDDHFMFTLNNYILGASTGEFIQEGYVTPATETEAYGSFYRYDWQSIVGQVWHSGSNYGTYCLGEEAGVSTCMLPRTQQTGNFQLDIGEAPVQTIMAASGTNNNHEFKFIVTGDNDTDCRSSAFSFNASVRYVIPSGDYSNP